MIATEGGAQLGRVLGGIRLVKRSSCRLGTEAAGRGLRREGLVMTARSWRSVMEVRGTKMRWVLERMSGGVRWRPASLMRSSSEGGVDGGEAFEQVAGAEGEAEPEAFAAGLGEKGAAGEALGVGGVVEVEVADVADVLMSLRSEGDDTAGEVEEVDACALRVTKPERGR